MKINISFFDLKCSLSFREMIRNFNKFTWNCWESLAFLSRKELETIRRFVIVFSVPIYWKFEFLEKYNVANWNTHLVCRLISRSRYVFVLYGILSVCIQINKQWNKNCRIKFGFVLSFSMDSKGLFDRPHTLFLWVSFLNFHEIVANCCCWNWYRCWFVFLKRWAWYLWKSRKL